MPTARPRYQVTETPEVAAALAAAARRWPGESRKRLLLRLVEEGHSAIAQQRDAAASARHSAITAIGDSYADAYEGDYLATLRDDWAQ